MLTLLTVTTDWILVVVGIIGLIGIVPIIVKWTRKRKVPKQVRDALAEQDRKTQTRPNFELHASLNTFQNKLIKLKNVGSKATDITVVAHGTHIQPKLVLDKLEAESEEGITIFLGDHFRILPNELFELHIGYADLEGRRYQQTCSKTHQKAHLTAPILLVTKK